MLLLRRLRVERNGRTKEVKLHMMRRMDNRRMMTMRDMVERLFGDSPFARSYLSDMGFSESDQYVPVNVFELPEGLMVVAPMPGLQADDVELTISENMLTLRGRRSPGQDDREYILKEWDYGPYTRTLELPFPIDTEHIIATLDNGILTVNLRKSQSAMPKRIHVRSVVDSSPTGGETHHSEQGRQRENG
jgi:HSP20 family protein